MSVDEGRGLHGAIAQLDALLLMPIVSGELLERLNGLQRACAELQRVVRMQASGCRRELYNAMTDQHASLHARVEQLRIEDERLLANAERLHRSIARLVRYCTAIVSDEHRAKSSVERMTRRGLEFLTRMRKQEGEFRVLSG